MSTTRAFKTGSDHDVAIRTIEALTADGSALNYGSRETGPSGRRFYRHGFWLDREAGRECYLEPGAILDAIQRFDGTPIEGTRRRWLANHARVKAVLALLRTCCNWTVEP